MKIAADTVVTLTYDITDAQGEVIESSDISGPISFIVGRGAIIKGLDARLMGMEEGQDATFEFAPEEAFGRPEDGPTKVVARSEFPPDAKLDPGVRFAAGMKGGSGITLEVVSIVGDEVTVRIIHPLAGQRIGMGVKIEAVREATKAELDEGQVISRPPPPPKKK